MTDNDTVETPSAVSNTEVNKTEEQERESNNVENNNTEEQPKDEPKNDDTKESEIDKSKRTAKILLIFVNVCTLICSIILFVVGVMMTASHANIHREWEAGEGFLNASIICIVISLVLALVGSMGLVGAVRENRCLLIAFCVFLGMLICVEISIGVSLLALAREHNLGAVVSAKMTSSMRRYDKEGHDGLTKVWDVVQTELNCCGVTNATDWFRNYSRNKNKSKKILPESCCATKPFQTFGNGRQYHCTYGDSQHPHNKIGCLGALEESIKRNEGIISAVTVVVALGQIGLIVASVHLMKNTKKPSSCPPCY